MNKKTVALLMACVLLVGAAIGGTMAWLVDSTGEVTNTFTVGDINITLTETDEGIGIDTETEENQQAGKFDGNNEYHFVPGDTLPKDPKVTVSADSEACWLFVKVTDAHNEITDTENGNKIVNWTVNTSNDEWKPVPNENGYWYREVDKGAGANGFYVFTDGGILNDSYTGEVTVSTKVTKDMVTTINTAATKPTIKIMAAAVQKAHIGTVADAFAQTPESFRTNN